MNTKTQTEKVIGQTYQRDRFEVHTRHFDTDTNAWGEWVCQSRRARTIEDARTDLATMEQGGRFLRSWVRVVGEGAQEARIVKVTATCEVVE